MLGDFDERDCATCRQEDAEHMTFLSATTKRAAVPGAAAACRCQRAWCHPVSQKGDSGHSTGCACMHACKLARLANALSWQLHMGIHDNPYTLDVLPARAMPQSAIALLRRRCWAAMQTGLPASKLQHAKQAHNGLPADARCSSSARNLFVAPTSSRTNSGAAESPQSFWSMSTRM